MTDLQTTPVTDAQQVGFGLDKGWIITSAGFVFFMLIGLGLMEIGSIRRKNSRIVWYKILINLISTIFWWWIIGYAWAFGNTNGSFIGAERFYAGNKWGDPNGQYISGPAFNGTGPSVTPVNTLLSSGSLLLLLLQPPSPPQSLLRESP